MTPLFGRPIVRCLTALLFAVGPAVSSADDSSFTSKAGVGKVNGADIYGHICQGCHMPQGQGAVGAGHYPKLAGDPALASWQFVALTVLGGRNGMPPFGISAEEAQATREVRLSDDQVADVVNYVRSHFGNTYKEKVTASQVAKLPHPGVAASP